MTTDSNLILHVPQSVHQVLCLLQIVSVGQWHMRVLSNRHPETKLRNQYFNFHHFLAEGAPTAFSQFLRQCFSVCKTSSVLWEPAKCSVFLQIVLQSWEGLRMQWQWAAHLRSSCEVAYIAIYFYFCFLKKWTVFSAVACCLAILWNIVIKPLGFSAQLSVQKAENVQLLGYPKQVEDVYVLKMFVRALAKFQARPDASRAALWILECNYSKYKSYTTAVHLK